MMLGLLIKKELKVFFMIKGNLAVMILLPIMLLTIFGSALGTYMQADYGTFEDGTVLYFIDGANAESLDRFWDIADEISAATGVTFAEADNTASARMTVESSGAYSVITVSDSGFEYFRSTFNEPEGGKLVRSLFVQLADAGTIEGNISLEHTVLPVEQVDSKAYYTFASLAFSIMFMGLLVGFSVHNEKSLNIIERIQLSKAGIGRMFTAKIIIGIFCGIVQTAVIFLFSTLVFQVSWGTKAGWILLLYLLLALFSSIFGGVAGMICKEKSMCQSIVLTVSMLSGYLGGSITPIYLLENTPVMRFIVNLSPLYWINRAVANLRSGILDSSSLYAALVLLGMIIVIAVIGYAGNKRISSSTSRQKGVRAA